MSESSKKGQIEAGSLRHRIDIEQHVHADDPLGGVTTTWAPWATNVPAKIEPLSAREFYSAGLTLGETAARITIRWREGIAETMRVVHNGRYYNIRGILPDLNSGRSYITLVTTAGTSEG